MTPYTFIKDRLVFSDCAYISEDFLLQCSGQLGAPSAITALAFFRSEKLVDVWSTNGSLMLERQAEQFSVTSHAVNKQLAG